MEEKKREKELPPRAQKVPCREPLINLEKTTPGRIPFSYDALPRDTQFAYMTPSYYTTGFRILDVYKTEVDFSEFRKFLFLEDPKQENKWGLLKKRMPYPVGRVTDLPGTRELDYKNYRLRSLTPESALSWRKSIKQIEEMTCLDEEESEPEFEPECAC